MGKVYARYFKVTDGDIFHDLHDISCARGRAAQLFKCIKDEAESFALEIERGLL